MNSVYHTELSSLEETRCQFNGTKADIKSAEGRMRPVCALGIDVHQDFYVVVMQEGSSNPKPPQRFGKEAFLQWAARLKQCYGQVHAVYEACGFGFCLQRQLSALGIECYVVCPQKLDELAKRVKTDSLDARALCLRLDRFLQGNRAALALVRGAKRRRGTGPCAASATRAVGQSAQGAGSAGAQFNGQSRD